MAKRKLEHRHQAALFAWAKTMSAKYPELGLLFAIPNEVYLPMFIPPKDKAVLGKFAQLVYRILRLNQMMTAKYFVKEGLKKGIPDIFLPVPRCGYHGLFVELKAGQGRADKTQKGWHEQLEKQGYKVAVCKGWQEARDVIIDYLNCTN